MIGIIALYALAAIISLPALALGCECLLALLPMGRIRRRHRRPRPRLAVLIPAHNEQELIASAVAAVKGQLNADDHLVVIADNCCDDTADAARSAGATVWERCDPERRGKGYAICHALERLQEDPPEVVICIDADCIPELDSIDKLARAAAWRQRPVQAAFLMHAVDGAPVQAAVSSFAVLVKNYVRPRGLGWLGLPCLITGSGVAYPWQSLRSAPHPQAHIVEDMRYSIDLALAGFPTHPCMEAVVHSQLPAHRDAFLSQRTRWEHGHLQLLASQCPRLACGFLRTGNPKLLALAMELSIPPLSLFLPAFAAAGALLLVAAWSMHQWPAFGLWAVSAAIASAGLFFAWFAFGRETLPPRRLMAVPGYVAAKVPIYRQLLKAPQRTWIRTQRDATPAFQMPVPAPHFNLPSTQAEARDSALTDG